MKKIIRLLYSIFIIVHSSLPEEFMYPVAQIDEQHLFIMHQKSIDDLELFVWNAQNKIATKALNSIFLPSHVKMLPSNTGFSFMDRGRLRIKMFEKRAPKTVDILEPIDSITAVHWIDDYQFYLVGRLYQKYNVFLCEHFETSYQIYCVTDQDAYDYIYPCKIDDSLFCISKNAQQTYFITEQPWNPTPYGKPRCENMQNHMIESSDPLCFLHMTNKNHGYYLKCNQANDALIFSCYSCTKYKNSWDSACLFSFNIPTKYLLGESEHRVYESIYPFLPNYNIEGFIYFVNYDKEQQLPIVNRYDIRTGIIDQPLAQRKTNHEFKGFLAPFHLGNNLYGGIITTSQKTIRATLKLDEETGAFNLSLPILGQISTQDHQ